MIGPNSHAHDKNMLFAQGILNALGGVIAAWSWGALGGGSFYLACAIVILSGLIALIVVSLHPHPFSDISASLIFAANLIPVFLVLWTSHAALATQSVYWIPFEPHGLTCLTIAILAPPVRWIGIPAILVSPILASLQYMNLARDQLRWLPARPLLSVFAFAAFSVVLYLFRLRGLRVAAFAAKATAEAEMMRKMTRTVIAVKDLANSPIQALTLDAETLSRRNPENAEIAARIRTSCLQLRNLNHILDEYLRREKIDPVDTSFDSYDELGVERPKPIDEEHKR
jgi:hypothetical protein